MIYVNLRAEMSRRNITSAMLADELKMAKSTISAKMNDPKRITLAECKKIESAFFPGMGVEYLFEYQQGKE